MQRKRHMVDISDYAWDKLERLANRLDAAQFVYKGRPRYGKLIELAIEKLEDSTMEWTVEEIEWGDEIPELNYDNGVVPVSEATKDWWLANPNITPIEATIETPPKGYVFGYNTPKGEPVYYKEKAKHIEFKVKAPHIDPDLLEETKKTVAKAMAIQLEKQVEEAIVTKKPVPPVPPVMWVISQPAYIELGGTLTQALSAPQQMILRNFAYAAFAEFSGDEGKNALSVSMKNMPWNKLWISATYADPSKLTKKLKDVAETVTQRVTAWLLQGNFIGPLPQAVDITEKQVSCQHKTEKAIDGYGTLRVYNTYNFKVSLTPFDSIALTDNKYKISNVLTTLLLDKHGYDPYSTKAGERVLWNDDHDGTVRISASIIKNSGTYGLGQSQEFMTKAIEYLTIVVNSIQNHPHEPVF